MVFSSALFLFLFLPLTLAIYALTRCYHRQAGKLTLILASLVFYAAWDIRFVPLILATIAINYALGQRLQRQPSKGLLVLGIAYNLGLLGVYKYSDFAIETLNQLGTQWSLLHLSLPLAISFFTVQHIAYLVDAQQQNVRDDAPLNYALFVLFFPQLIAGPIVHHREMMGQYRQLPLLSALSPQSLCPALVLIIVGVFKKIVIADSLAHWVRPAFADPAALTVLDAWTGLLAYTFQLYFDFSAYSEIAMGVALCFGITLPLNFNAPYQAATISGFWRRWHMTLGRFLRHYVYIPLGGNRHSLGRTAWALTLTMLLGGLWHGAGWTFILWGALHGLYLSVCVLWQRLHRPLPKPLAVGLTLFCVTLAWVPFRATSLDDALAYWAALFDCSSFVAQPLHRAIAQDLGLTLARGPSLYSGWELGVLALLLMVVLRYPTVHAILATFQPTVRSYAWVSAGALLAISLMGRPQTFIYFDF